MGSQQRTAETAAESDTAGAACASAFQATMLAQDDGECLTDSVAWVPLERCGASHWTLGQYRPKRANVCDATAVSGLQSYSQSRAVRRRRGLEGRGVGEGDLSI